MSGQRAWLPRLAAPALLALLLLAPPSRAQAPARPPLYEPPDGSAYSGMYIRLWDSSDPKVGDLRPFATRLQDSIDQDLSGKPPAIMLVPATWQRDDGVPIPFENALEDIHKLENFGGTRIVPYLKWYAQTGFGNAGGPRAITTRDIEQGKLDDYIRKYARDVRDYGRPIFITPICAEFNGEWWNCSPGGNPSLTAADFVNAWRRTVDLFRTEGAANVAWVWAPIPQIASANRMDFAPFWPGDEYVDWAGVDMYDNMPPSAIEPAYQFAVAHGKPFFLGEWGTRLAGAPPQQERDWLSAMFDVFDSHPKVKAIVYYNYKQLWDHETPAHMEPHTFLYGGQVNYHPNGHDGDSRLLADSGAGFRELYAQRIANPRYLSSVVGLPTPAPPPDRLPDPSSNSTAGG
jgi:Glycosyl hydrolase family 26